MNRRAFLKDSTALLISDKTLNVLVVGGHPGDPEYGCGGTVARYAEAHHRVTMLYLNRGEKGCAGKPAEDCGHLRTEEANHACSILGASAKFADQVDGEAAVNPVTYDKFAALIREANPNVVFTQWPLDNHRDHRAGFNFTYDAWLRMKKSFELYFYEVSDGEDSVMFAPSEYVDISTVEAKKRAACFAHASQSPERYWALQSEVARFRGIESGTRLAEAFVRHRESSGRLLP